MSAVMQGVMRLTYWRGRGVGKWDGDGAKANVT
jgi:hypothetical protein